MGELVLAYPAKDDEDEWFHIYSDWIGTWRWKEELRGGGGAIFIGK